MYDFIFTKLKISSRKNRRTDKRIVYIEAVHKSIAFTNTSIIGKHDFKR